jgi:glycosyltransferase involved in cell wall biosynthesis
MIEALACGTPVIAWPNGSVSEVLEHGRTGFIVDSVEEAARAVRRVAALNRPAIRSAFEERFDAARMAQDYLTVYRRMMRYGPPPCRHERISAQRAAPAALSVR